MVTQEDGTAIEKMCRDSVQKPKRVNINPSPLPAPPPAKPPKPKPVGGNVRAWTPEQAPNKKRRVIAQNRKRAAEREIIDAAAIEWRAPAFVPDALRPSWKETAVERIAKRLKVSEATVDANESEDNDLGSCPSNNVLSLITVNYVGPLGARGSGDGAEI